MGYKEQIKSKKTVKGYWRMKKLLIILALVTAGCSSTKMIQSKYGFVHKYQIEEIERVKRYNQ